MNNKGADQTVEMRRLICAFVVCIWHKQVFSWCGSFTLEGIILAWNKSHLAKMCEIFSNKSMVYRKEHKDLF